MMGVIAIAVVLVVVVWAVEKGIERALNRRGRQ